MILLILLIISLVLFLEFRYYVLLAVLVIVGVSESINLTCIGFRCVGVCQSLGPVLSTSMQKYCVPLLARGVGVTVGPFAAYLQLTVPVT